MNPQAHAELLPLRDIHVEVVSWWPPAPGWWLLAILLLAALVVVIAWWRRRLSHRRRWHALQSELDAIAACHAQDGDRARLAAEVSALMRRGVRARAGAAHLDGAAWITELERIGGAPLPPELSVIAEGAAYRREIDLDVAATLAACAAWLRRVMEQGHA